MKIQFDIPDFVPPERIIHILAGIECIGYITPHDRKVFVKVNQCSNCGKCCLRYDCQHVVAEPGTSDRYRCKLGRERPVNCCVGDGNIPECTVRYVEVEG